MPAIDQQTAIFVLWGVTALVMAWTWIPAVISSLGGTRYLCGGTNDMRGMEPSKTEPDYSFWAQQLLDLGYEPLGNGWMRVNFAGAEWSTYSPVRVFTHQQKQCFAFMQKAPAPFWFWPGAMFATVWVDGGMLISDNNLAADPNPELELIRQGMVTLRLADLESLHLATMEVLRRSGKKPEIDLSMDTLWQAALRNFGPDVKRLNTRAGTQYIFAHGLIHLCLSTPAAYVAGITHWSVPLVNLILAVVMIFGENSQKRQYARVIRSAFQERQGSTPDEG